MAWTRYVNENGVPDEIGTDGGTIVADDEHEHGARITLEQGGIPAPFSITCGIYGWMVHTRMFSSLDEARPAYDAMKPGLSEIVDLIPLRADPAVEEKTAHVVAAITAFVGRFP